MPKHGVYHRDMDALQKAIETVGGQSELARQLGTSAQAVNNWCRRRNVPPEYAPVIESITGGLVKAEDLCPQIPWHIVRSSEAA